ncbi:hypothetical protein GWO43_15615 [candidate division KSB1 bacterium]|nr:hypothetical protein [candidate division KSB1 bacterium]NIR68442.1 hypothetical protein [candidate division KSB1 bacterium]NIS25394.1 hypothetical protein [candidate division KSB1 bacterium]NIT72271.1 hypothetical protein [candidate division KSB1 bacterium]NIU26076.1 hypothetical protein [candidate division KSB1 bacterium]
MFQEHERSGTLRTSNVIEKPNSLNQKGMEEVIDRVDVRINNVDIVEISQLTTGVYDLKSPQFREEIVKTHQGMNDFVLTVSPASLHQVKTALQVVLKIVTADRVAIET